MSNITTFAAYAYLKETNNPYSALCNYICYAIHLIGKETVSLDEIESKVYEEFLVEYKANLLNACIRCLVNEKRIAISKYTKGITLLKLGFDLDRFMSDRSVLKQQEYNFINQLIIHTEKLGSRGKWSNDEARKYLGRYLLNDELALNHILNGAISNEKVKQLSPEWYIADFIRGLSAGSEEYNYIVNVSHGLMVYIGMTETTNSDQEVSQKFRGTEFFLDTKLVLRAMGYTLPFYKKCAIELIDIIRNDNKGKVKIFEHTFSEIETALFNAERELRQTKRVKDVELNMYSIYNCCDADDFYTYHKSAREYLEKTLEIAIVSSNQDWNDNTVRINNLDWEGLERKIASDHPHWNPGTILNDIRSLNIVNHLRKGDYSQHFGGKKQLPIFVTTNTGLIASVREFIISNYEKNDSGVISGWSRYRLPIISESNLLCRLWLPQSNVRSDLPISIIAANVFAAQQAEVEFYDRIKSSYKKINVTHKGIPIDIDDFRQRKLEEGIATLSHGEIDLIDDTLAAQSVSDIIKAETIHIAEDRDELSASLEKAQQEKLEEHFRFLEAYSAQLFQNIKGRVARLFLKINTKVWPYILSIAIGVVCEIPLLITQNYILVHPMLQYAPLAITALSSLLFTVVKELKLTIRVRNKVKTIILGRFRVKIEKKIDLNLKEYYNDIINLCLDLLELKSVT